MKKQVWPKKVVAGAIVPIVIAAASVAVPAPASAAVTGISGATTWFAPCEFYTSSNARTASQPTIKVALSSVGSLGVKFRTKFTNTGTVSSTAFFSGSSSTFETLSSNTATGREFRSQFSCINGRDSDERPSTDFSGSLDS